VIAVIWDCWPATTFWRSQTVSGVNGHDSAT
jgi:hypothetical protein